jgi:predicted PurR-regulated permease PerM
LLLLLIISGIIFLISWQITTLTQDLENIEDKIQTLWQQLSQYITQLFGLSGEQQQQALNQQAAEVGLSVARLNSILFSVFINFVLMLVYIFLFIYYRGRIRNFILQLVSKEDTANTNDAIESIQKISQQYVTGLGMMIVCLWIMYGIGFSLLGLKHALFFAVLCGLFEIVPFVGNLTGSALAVLMALIQGGGTPMIIGIVLTYGLIQFIQTYLLEPLIVGSEVNLNPLCTIAGLVLGELVWGIEGLVLAIPLLGLTKIICDHIPSLKPMGYLMGRGSINKNSLLEKIKMKFR